MSTPPSFKLTVFPARAAARAVILRRGPTRMFHVISWNMATDRFEHGSWFRGRIFEESCDISPDGRYFRYVACNGSHKTRERIGFNAWVAICRPPRLTALSMTVCIGTWHVRSHFVTATDPEFSTAFSDPCLPRRLRLSFEPRPEPKPWKVVPAVENADWVGINSDGQLIYTIGSQVWRCSNRNGKLQAPKLIADFSDLVPPWQTSQRAE